MPLTEEQLEIRKKGITASEITAVAGLSKYAGPHDVWADKCGLAPPTEVNEHMERGIELEDAIRNWTGRRLGIFIEHPGVVGTIQSPTNPIVIATPDGLCHEQNEKTMNAKPFAVFEAKAPGQYPQDWQDPEEAPDGIPAYVYPQVIWQMAAAELHQAIVAGLVNGLLWTYVIEFIPELFDALLEKAQELMHYVETRQPPPLDGTTRAADWMRKHYEQNREDLVVLQEEEDGPLYDLCWNHQQMKKEYKALEGNIKVCGAEIINRIGEDAGIQGAGWKATYKTTKGSVKLDYKGLVEEMGPPQEMIEKHTRIGPGHRRFLISLKKDDKLKLKGDK